MKKLASLNKYFIKYKWRFIAGLLFVAVSNLLAVVSPVVVRNIIDKVSNSLEQFSRSVPGDAFQKEILQSVLIAGLVLLGLALLRGIFMFFMRQTVIVMSRHIEYDQKNEIYRKYQELPASFYKKNFTGDLMNRISEDVSRVRMYTGPAIMYSTNVVVLTVMCVWGMVRVNPMLTLYVMLPLPLLAIAIYYVNKIIYRKSSKIQAQLSSLTTTAQETYAAIRVVKSFVQEENMIKYFDENSEKYRRSTINLSLTEAIYAPAMYVFTGLSMLCTILIGGYLAIKGEISTGNIAEFVIYINMLLFPISSIGMIATMIQRAGASQERIDEFMTQQSDITEAADAVTKPIQGAIELDNVSFTYQNTGITALKDFSLYIKPGEKVAIMGATGSGKTTLAHLLLRMYNVDKGEILVDDIPVASYKMAYLRQQISYAPQDTFLFSDTVYNNIKFGMDTATEAMVKQAALIADLDKDIHTLANGYETVIGERGVMLSGGQKQRVVLARAILKQSPVLILDDVLAAVDVKTEQKILANLKEQLRSVTTLFITHRIFQNFDFDKIVVVDKGEIVEMGTHDELLEMGGHYAALYEYQTQHQEA